MKKLIFAIVIMMSSVEMFAGPIVTVHFEIGRKSMDCRGFGICNAGVDVNWRFSTMRIDSETNSLQIAISKEMISGKEEYFKSNTVTFEETAVLSQEIQKALGATNRVAIEKGTYALVRTKTGYQINVPIKK